TMTLHRELERRFAAFKGAEAALMFPSGFAANAGTVSAILTREDVIVSDELNHASIIDGARLSRAEIKVFPHRDVAAADRLLEETASEGRNQLLPTGGGRRVHQGARRPGTGAGAGGPAVGADPVLQGRAGEAGVRHRVVADADHTGHRRRGGEGPAALRAAVGRGRVHAGGGVPDR